jgi:uncharacterized protein YgiM (DUF1202 family)
VIIGYQRRISVRKGRCSNDPQNCTLAGQKTELPYAGIDSVCPECGSPLAAIASSQSAPPPPPPPPPPQVVQPDYQYAAPPEPMRQSSPRYEETLDYEPQSRAPGNAMMKLTQVVIVGAALALLGFFAWRMFLQPRPVQGPELAATANVTGVGAQQVTQISPAQLRRVSVTTEARTIPDPASAIVAPLQAGAVLDVTGQISVNGINWVRVSLPNDSSRSGFVREDQLANLGDGTLTVSPSDAVAVTPATGQVPPTAPGVMGPVQVREPTTFYIASVRANVRQAADAASAKVGAFEFTDAITVVGQRSVGNSVWYQVQLPSGGTGWINGRLVSSAPRDIPLDNATATPPATITKLPAKPGTSSDTPASEIGKTDDQAAMSAFGPGATIRVDAAIANLRKEPGATGNSVVEELARDTLMSVEDVRIINGVPWYRVTSPNRAQGWVSGRTVVENN